MQEWCLTTVYKGSRAYLWPHVPIDALPLLTVLQGIPCTFQADVILLQDFCPIPHVCCLAPVFHITGPFVAFQFLLSVTSLGSSPPALIILSHLVVNFHHSIRHQKVSVHVLVSLCGTCMPSLSSKICRTGTLSGLLTVVFAAPRLVLARGRFLICLDWLNECVILREVLALGKEGA